MVLDTDGELLLWKGVVSEGLTVKAHLSKNMKVGRENKVQRSWDRCVLGVFKEEPGGQCDWAQVRRGWQMMASGRDPEARACSVL